MNNKNSYEWLTHAKGLIKSELKKRNISYGQLALRLRAIGLNDSPENINAKINRGTFSAVFFFQCMTAIGVKKINLEDLYD